MIGRGFVRLQIHRRIDFSKQKPGAVRARDEIGVLPLPSEPTAFVRGAFP